MRSATALWLGRRGYREVHALQLALVEARQQKRIRDTILLVEHDPVVTLGRGAKAENILLDERGLGALGIDMVETGRGGDVTLHGPGQLVCYPILDLRPDRCDLRRYVRSLAEVMILLAREQNVEAGTVHAHIGVWADAERPDQWGSEAWASQMTKIGAIGVRVSRWVTMHGFALNLDIDLGLFGVIVPCGIKEHPVDSIASLTGRSRKVRDTALGAAGALSTGLDLEVPSVIDASDARDMAALLGLDVERRERERVSTGGV